jgi:hypothetical protein
MKLKIILALSIGLLFSPSSILSQNLKRPIITGVPFLNIPLDARSGGMGETGVGTSEDAYSQFHNPTKYLFYFDTENKGLSVSYVPQFMGIANDIFLANVIYFNAINDRSVLSGSISYSNFGEMEIEEQLGSEIINQGFLNPNDFALDLSYSLLINNYFGMSVTGRYIRSNLTEKNTITQLRLNSSNAAAVDISAYYSSAYNRGKNIWTFGVNLKNLGTKLDYSNDKTLSYPLPTVLKLGGSYHILTKRSNIFSLSTEVQKFLVPSLDENGQVPEISVVEGLYYSLYDAPEGFKEELRELIFNIGSEYEFNKSIAFRTGYIFQNLAKGNKNHLTIGTGFKLEHLLFDLAYQFPLRSSQPIPSANSVRVSISYNFGNS